MKKVTLIEETIKHLSSDPEERVHVGLDVHKRSISVAIWCQEQIVTHWRMPAEAQQLIGKLRPLLGVRCKVVYEAGPTGYGLVRLLRGGGFDADVVAPSYTPVLPGRRVKTDRLDCIRLAQLSAKDLLRAVAVPSEREEGDRQLVRLRDQLRLESARVKVRIKLFLLQHGIAEPAGLAYFTGASVARLRQLELSPQLRLTLDVLLESLEFGRRQLGCADKRIEELTRRPRHAAAVALLRTHPGVGPVVSAAFRMELYRPERFSSAGAVARYVGLAPTVAQSGERRHGGPISRSGRPSLRRLLVEASWSWIQYDQRARAVYCRLVHNSGSSRKAIVAMARRLAVNLWCMLVRGQAYRQPSTAAA